MVATTVIHTRLKFGDEIDLGILDPNEFDAILKEEVKLVVTH